MVNKRKVLLDVFLNIVATALPLCALQLIALPIIAGSMPSDEYGVVVTMLSVFSLGPGVLGMVLNNMRLLFDSKYEELGISGDFNILLIVFAVIASFLMIASQCILTEARPLSLFLAIATSITWLTTSYFVVVFRIALNYKAIFLNGVVQSVGYLLGAALFFCTGEWLLVYLCGQLLSLVFVLRGSRLLNEPVLKTALFPQVCKESAGLTISSLLSNAMNYVDRIILLPLIGGAGVGAYYVSTLVGKIVSMAVSPMNGVVLSYLSKVNNKPDKVFYIAMGSCLFVCVLAYGIIILLGGPVLSFLYPSFAEEALLYLPITSITALVCVLASVAQPFTLKYYAMKWQIVINGVTCILYISLSILLLLQSGLMGFCVGVLAVNIARLTIMVSIYVFKRPDSKSLS